MKWIQRIASQWLIGQRIGAFEQRLRGLASSMTGSMASVVAEDAGDFVYAISLDAGVLKTTLEIDMLRADARDEDLLLAQVAGMLAQAQAERYTERYTERSGTA